MAAERPFSDPRAAPPDRTGEGRERPGQEPRRFSPRRMHDLPRDPAPDARVALLRDGYRFIPRRCARLRTDAFRTRLMLQDAICMQGPDAAELLYGASGLTRVGAMPQTSLRLLQDKGSVQQLDGAAHRHRKAMFLSILLDETRIDRLAEAFRDAWRDRLADWERQDEIVLLPEANAVITHAALRWCGIPMTPREGEEVAGTLLRMVEGAGGVLRAAPALARREGLEERLRDIVRDARAQPADATPLHVIARHRDTDGALLTEEAAATELLNVLRPLAATARYVAFAALVLHQLPEWRDRFATGSDCDLTDFAEELRRIAPFFPFTAAIAREPVRWRDMVLPKGQWVLFDLYGTCQDPAIFPDPGRFRPKRMLSWRDEDHCFVPQGAGPVASTHRCPGEMAVVRLICEAVRMLCCEMDYRVPPQDLSVRLRRIPARPESGMILADVRRTGIHPN